MNPDKPLAAEQEDLTPPADLDLDAIPILEEALDLSELHGQEGPLAAAYQAAALPPSEKESNMSSDFMTPDGSAAAEGIPAERELNVDLGYLDTTGEAEEDNLASYDEIQTLPLAEMILEDDRNSLISPEQKKHIETLEAIVFASENPNAPAPKQGSIQAEAPAPEAAAPVEPPAPSAAPVSTPNSVAQTPFTPPPAPAEGRPLPKKSENPFLPQHILDRLNQGKRNLVEEIAQSSAALDASTAILRTHARAERLNRSTYGSSAYGDSGPQYSFSRDKSAMQKQKLVDDLVDEYLPLIAAELRRRLRKMLDE